MDDWLTPMEKQAIRLFRERHGRNPSHINNKKIPEGNNMAITKSRYEVVSDLESQKRELMKSKENLDLAVMKKEKEIKGLKREVEDAEDDLKEYKETLKDRKNTIDLQLESIDDALKRLSQTKETK